MLCIAMISLLCYVGRVFLMFIFFFLFKNQIASIITLKQVRYSYLIDLKLTVTMISKDESEFSV